MDILNLVKQYLRIDFDDDDDILRLFIDEAKQYILDTSGSEFNAENINHKLLLLAVVKDFYDDRGSMADKPIHGHKYLISSIIMREQLKNTE